MATQPTRTELPIENDLPKLIRDKIPEIIRQNENRETVIRILGDDQEFLLYVLKKMTEESAELVHAATDTELREEIADVYEIIDTILKLKGWTAADIAGVQDKKRQERGGFEQRVLMLGKN